MNQDTFPSNRNNYRIFRNNNFRQNNYRQNIRSQSVNRRYDNGGYGFNSRPSIQPQRSRSRQRNQNGPRVLRLNDYMPPELRDDSPNFNPVSAAITAPNTRPVTPIDALPQRQNFATDITQPFGVSDQSEALVPRRQERNGRQHQGENTTSSYRRRQRRVRQRQYREMIDNTNRFNVLLDEVGPDDTEEQQSDPNANNSRMNVKSSKKQKLRLYLEHNRIMSYLQKNCSTSINSRGNQAYVLAATPIYDEWVRNNYELQVWQAYLKMGMEQKHWSKEIIQRTKRRDDVTCTRFVQKKINQLLAKIAQANATISDLQIQLNIYWNQLTNPIVPPATTTTNTTISTITATPVITTESTVGRRDPVDRIEKLILKYIHQCTQHVKKLSENKIKMAKMQMEEFKALQDFEQIATPLQWNIHLTLKPKMKLWPTTNKNLQVALKRVEYDLPPNFIAKTDFNFKIDESVIGQEEAQELYNQMRQVTKDYRVKAMTVYIQALTREQELVLNEIKQIIEGFPKENDQDRIDSQPSIAAFKSYHELRRTGQSRSTSGRCPGSDTFAGRGFLTPAIINQANIYLTDEEEKLLKLGPKFIFNEPAIAARRRTIELATLKRKIEQKFHEKKVCPGRPVNQFIAELDLLLQKLHATPIPLHRRCLNNSKDNHFILEIPSQSIVPTQSVKIISKRKKNYSRLVKRLRHKFRLNNVILQKTDKSKVFHLGKLEDYQKKSQEYMEKTQAYRCLGTNDPLPDLIQRTNKYLLDLRLAKWITQKQYELLCIKPNEVELAHLYYLPKAHKLGTPLRPFISGLRHPTIKISKFLDDLLRPLFNEMAKQTTIDSGFELIKKLEKWSEHKLNDKTLLCTIDVTDLYTMIPQIEGILSLKKMLDSLKLQQIAGLKTETIIRLSRFVMKNNYFYYDGKYYHQIRGEAMGSPLTLTIANCYMFFFERKIVNQVNNSGGLYLRYIDDIFLAINWPERHLKKQIENWNQIDENIKLKAHIGYSTNFLDLLMENNKGQLITQVYHKPSYEPYYLPFNSIHPMHMKKNIAFVLFLRAIRYCSSFHLFINEREAFRIGLLLNKYPNELIQKQFDLVLQKFRINDLISIQNYNQIRMRINSSKENREKLPIDYEEVLFVHFTYCFNMRTFPIRFHNLWKKYFSNSPINDIQPILGTRNTNNLQQHLIHTKNKLYFDLMNKS
ncbi:unnamed protein product [Rotaria sp. Silwood2]|nr:unnamed protein product [Rotaria sp. Silwood2]